MPSRIARLLALVALTPLSVATTSSAQQLKMPSDPLAGTVIESSDPPAGAVTLTPSAANTVPMGGDISMSTAAPTSAYSSGSYYNPTLGSHIRASYTTQSYGQEDGLLTLGTMKLFEADGGMTFVDGQVTMNDSSDVGYNLGIGYRWMTLPLFPYSPDSQKIMGVSLWSDGLSKGGDNFFPQVGVALEFLGEHLDFRANGYAPVGERTQTRDFFTTGNFAYAGNSIGTQLQGVADTALTIGEAELAGRIADLDAWVFGGVYGFNGGAYDGVGGKVGLRGYATPDLLVSVAIANDDEFDTNALVNLTWFIGRTRAENCPTGQLHDRFREPVVRNNYVALQQSTAFASVDSIVGVDGNALRVVHVDSSAAAGGDGTFENPLNSLDDIQGASQTGDIILAHSGSTFNGQAATLQDNQFFFGEGGDNALTVNTLALGVITLPETSTGASSGAVPIISGAPAAAVTLANGNTVQNLSFDGGVNAITTDTVNGTLNATLANLTVMNTTGPSLFFDANTDGTVLVTESAFTGNTGPALSVNGSTANITFGDTNTIADNSGRAIEIIGNTGVVSVGAEITTDTSVNGGGVYVEANEGIVSFTGAINANGVDAVTINDSQANVTFGTGADVTSTGAGRAVVITDAGTNAATTSQVIFSGDITNEQGRAVEILRGDDAIAFNGEITDNGTGISVTDRSNVTGATVTFNGQTTINSGANDAVTLTNNGASSTVTFSNLDITTTGAGRGIVGSSGGRLNVTGTGSTISTQTGRALDITGGSSTTGLTFESIDVNGADRAILLTNFDGNVTVNGGTMMTTGQAIQTENAGLTLNDVAIDSGSGGAVSATVSNSTSRTVTLTDVDANGGDVVFQTSAGASGALTATVDNGGSTAGAAGQVGDVTFNSLGSGNSSLTLTDVEATGGFDLNVSGSGNLSTTMTNVDSTGAGATTLDVTSSGNGILTMTNVNTGGAISATSSAASSGDLIVNVSNSGNTDAFGPITFDDNGDGVATASFTNVTSTGGIDFDAAQDGNASLTVTGGSYGGPISFNEQGDGTATATLTNVTSTGGVDFNSAQNGNASLTVSGGSYGGPITADAANTLTGSFTARVTNGTTLTGTPQVAFNGQNTGQVTYQVSGLTFSTTVADAGIDLTIGSSVTTADVTVQNNNITQTNNHAFELAVTGGTVDFLLSGNTFANNSALQGALVTNNGGTLNATIQSNTMSNTGGDELLLQNASGSQTNLFATNNGGAGVVYDFENLSAATDFQVRGADAAAVDSANSAVIDFLPNDAAFTFDSNLVVPTP